MYLIRLSFKPFVPLLILFLVSQTVTAQDELNVISYKANQWLQFTDSRNALYHHFASEAYGHLEKRKQKVAAYSSEKEWQERQKWIKATLQKITGPFPERTPLNAQVVRTLDKEFFRVEHIVFESQPKFFVTSSLFIPKTLKKRENAPVVIYCSGHANEGYRSPVYQHVILNLVRKGFIVFAFDPVGQGERLEYYDGNENKSVIGGPTSEHSYPGSQTFISGSSQARYMIWDGIRAIDYLLTRKEVDPSRIGITGRSGGGTQSALIAAFDERIKAAAPECYITNLTRLLQSIGPQDAEQNLFHGISEGLDHGDLLIVRAPKPALMITTTRDMFSIQGARETAAEVSRIYSAYRQPGNFGMVEDDAVHASTKKNREAMYSFFQEHLERPGASHDEDVVILDDDEIKVTSTGQVSTSFKGETVFSLNRIETKKLTEALSASRADLQTHLLKVNTKARELSGYKEPGNISDPVFTGRIQREGYSVEKYFVKGEGDYVIPYLLMMPAESNGKAILFLHPSGKGAEALSGGEMEWFAKQGFMVLSPDLAGVGEMGQGDFKGDAFIGGISHNIWYSSILIGRSIAGLQAGDIARLVKVLEMKHGSNEIFGIARKELASALLHSAAFIPKITRVALIEPLGSYRSLVMNRFYHSPFIAGAVPAALTAYDLPDLCASLAPRKLLMIHANNEMGETANPEEVTEDVSFIKNAYSQQQSEGHLTIVGGAGEINLKALFSEWLK